MQGILTNPLLLSYGPIALVVAGAAAWNHFKKPPAAPPDVVGLLDAIDVLALEFMKDHGTTELGAATKEAFLEVAAAKMLVRKSITAKSC